MGGRYFIRVCEKNRRDRREVAFHQGIKASRRASAPSRFAGDARSPGATPRQRVRRRGASRSSLGGDRRGFAGAFGVPVKRQRLLVRGQGLLTTELVIEHREVGLGGIVPVRRTLPDPRTQRRLVGPKIQDPQRCTE